MSAVAAISFVFTSTGNRLYAEMAKIVMDEAKAGHKVSPFSPSPTPAAETGGRTMLGKVLVGYQGWFAPGEVGGSEPWRHYGIKGKFGEGSVVVDMWPDVSELDADERYPTPFHHADGRVAEVFSSANPKTVDRHFRWMKEYRIDGAFLQRFGVWLKDPDMKPFTDRVMDNVRQGAGNHGRQWAVMYDLSTLNKGDIEKYIIPDWKRLVDGKKIRADRQYLQHGDKPVVAVWGIGFDDGREYTLEECLALVRFLKNDPVYGGNAVMLGVPYWWRLLDRDCMHSPLVHELISEADIVSPWAVGRQTTPAQALTREKDPIAPDVDWLAKRKLDYLPVAFPGFSWYNLEQALGTKRGVFNQVPRLGGEFLWSQAVAAKRGGAKMLYVAMFDEIDEGTAIMKVSQDPPTGKDRFLTYEGLPSDYYLWLTGQIGRLMRGEIPATDTVPKRE